MSIIVLESKGRADKAAAYPLPPLPDVTPLKAEIREVYASATAGRRPCGGRTPCGQPRPGGGGS